MNILYYCIINFMHFIILFAYQNKYNELRNTEIPIFLWSQMKLEKRAKCIYRKWKIMFFVYQKFKEIIAFLWGLKSEDQKLWLDLMSLDFLGEIAYAFYTTVRLKPTFVHMICLPTTLTKHIDICSSYFI